MTAASSERPPIPTVRSTLQPFRDQARVSGGAGSVNWDAVERALVEREDAIVGLLHGAGAQFGLFPQIVAEVLAELGLGSPRSDAERDMIRRQFNDLMNQIARAQRGEGPMPTP